VDPFAHRVVKSLQWKEREGFFSFHVCQDNRKIAKKIPNLICSRDLVGRKLKINIVAI
jgi:hypothetical protein